jgi:acyl-CoA synthetase (AMP-forming)/AMP-acid ligase II
MYLDLISSLGALADEKPDQKLYTFLRDGETDAVSLTRAEVCFTAGSMAGELLARGLAGKVIVIALPPGLDFVVALLGCLFAGAIAAPAPPPLRQSDTDRLLVVLRGCRPSAIFVDRPILSEEATPRLTVTELVRGARAPTFAPAPEKIALLQYTSGTTSTPRGIAITHANLLHNAWLISEARDHAPYVGVIWLPPYHDMGLVGGVLHATFTGHPVILMSHWQFMQRPALWLRAISRFRGTLSAAPDFALRYCSKVIRDEDCVGLDLSSWEYLYCGSEPVQASTLKAFAARFERFGFRRSVFLPCYGLAENTLIVSGRTCVGGPDLSGEAVSCGPPLTPLAIVDPESGRPAERGEIWVSGKSVATGYRDVSGEISPFGGRLSQDGQIWLRTGDLGYLRDGELFVSGRIKNQIIIRGRNLHAEDLEATVRQAHDLLADAHCAAFLIEGEEEEEFAIAVEAPLRLPPHLPAAIVEEARKAVLKRHGVLPARICLVRRGVLPRTTSGKVQRHACADALKSCTLLAEFRRP